MPGSGCAHRSAAALALVAKVVVGRLLAPTMSTELPAKYEPKTLETAVTTLVPKTPN